MVVPDAGEVERRASALEPHTPREAIERGVAMVLQHFALVPVFTALENIVLGREPTQTGIAARIGLRILDGHRHARAPRRSRPSSA